MSFSVVVLGSSGMFATTERAAAGYLVNLGDKKLWLDAGAGTWRNLLEQIDYRSLHGILLTHRHPDHTSDAFMAYHARQYGDVEPLPQIPLWAPQQTFDHLLGFAPDLGESFHLRAIEPGDDIEIDDARITLFEMAHPPDTLGVRVAFGGAVLAYSADTGPSADIGALAGGSDVFICEATLQASDGEWEGHMTAAQAGAAGADAKVGRLVLTHLPPGRDHTSSLSEAQETAGDLRVDLASDLTRYEVG